MVLYHESRKRKNFFPRKNPLKFRSQKKLAPDADMIIQEVCKYYDVFLKDLFITKRGWFNKPRNIAIYLIRFMRSKQLLKIAEIFNIKGYSTVSNAIHRLGDLRKKDKKIRKDIDSIIKK